MAEPTPEPSSNLSVKEYDAIGIAIAPCQSAVFDDDGCTALAEAQTITVSTQSADFDDNDDNTTLAEDQTMAVSAQNAKLKLSFLFWKFLLLSATLILVMLAIVALGFGDGILLTRVPVHMTDDERKAVLDAYNSYSGMIATGIGKIYDVFLPMFVAVVFWAFATKWHSQRRKTNGSIVRMLPILPAASIGYLMASGLGALNVQLVPEKSAPRFTDNDFFSFSNESTRNTYSDENSWNNSILNTLLRGALEFTEHFRIKCINHGLNTVELGLPQVMYNFARQEWQGYAIPNAIEPEQTLVISFSDETPSISELPMEVNTARQLFGTSLVTLNTHLGILWDGGFINQYMNGKCDNAKAEHNNSFSDKLEVLLGFDNDDTFLNSSVSFLKEAFDNSTHIDTKNVNISYDRIAISSNIVFEAMTLRIPTIAADFDMHDYYWYSYCGESACVWNETEMHSQLPNPLQQWNRINPVVDVAVACNELRLFDGTGFNVPCNSSVSLITTGLAKKLIGKSWDIDFDNNSAEFGQVHAQYSLTVGYLTWTTEDIASRFGADCDAKDYNCTGIVVDMASLLSRGTALIVGDPSVSLRSKRDYLLDRDNFFSSYFSGNDDIAVPWIKLAILNSFNITTLYPRHFNEAPFLGVPPGVASDYLCNKVIEQYVMDVQMNHLYAETSLQMSYTAASYFLMQYGVLHKASNSTGSIVLEFPSEEFAVRASIPLLNIVMTLAGCGFLLILTIAVAIVHKYARQTYEIPDDIAVDRFVETMMNYEKYPDSLFVARGKHNGNWVELRQTDIIKVELKLNQGATQQKAESRFMP